MDPTGLLKNLTLKMSLGFLSRRGSAADLPRICRGSAADPPRIRRGSAADLPRIRRGSAADLPRICRGSAADPPRIHTFLDIFENANGLIRCFKGVFSKLSQTKILLIQNLRCRKLFFSSRIYEQTFQKSALELGHRSGIHRVDATSTAIFVNCVPPSV